MKTPNPSMPYFGCAKKKLLTPIDQTFTIRKLIDSNKSNKFSLHLHKLDALSRNARHKLFNVNDGRWLKIS